MAHFRVKPNQLDQHALEIRQICREIENFSQIVDGYDVTGFLSGTAASRVSSELKTLSSHLEQQRRVMNNLSVALNKISLSYKRTENCLSETPVFNERGSSTGETKGSKGEGFPESKKGASVAETGKSGISNIKQEEETQDSKSNSNAWKSAAATTTGSVLGFKTRDETSGELFGYSTKTEYKTGAKYKDGKIDSVSLIEGSQSGEFHVAQGKAKSSWGWLSNEQEINVGQVAAKGSVGVTLVKNGKFSPQASINGELSGDVLKGKHKSSFGTDNTNVNASAEGSVLSGSIKGNAGIGKVTYKNKDGELKQAYGVAGEVKAEGYLAQGRVKGGFTILGVKISGGISGKAGGAGVSAGGHVGTGGIGGSVGLGLGLGLGLDLDIDWSGFKFGW